jgi:Flp pilus assembly protein TadG
MNSQRIKLNKENGVVLIFVALLLTVFLGIAALAVDIGFMYVARTELQRTADSAALAATRRLGLIYEGMLPIAQSNYVLTSDHSALIKNEAITVAMLNKVAGEVVTIHVDDIIIGSWHSGDTPPFVITSTRPSAVRVVTRRIGNDSRSTGPISTFFYGAFVRLLGNTTSGQLDVSAEATASLTSEATIGPGKLPIPVGISKAWFQNLPESCNQPIKFHPTNNLDGCAGFTIYGPKINDNNLRTGTLPWLTNLVDPSAIPGATVGETEWYFFGGTVTNVCEPFKALFDAKKNLTPGSANEWDADADPNTWTAAVVIYDRDDCSNPNPGHGEKEIPIAGFSTVVISNVDCSLGGNWIIDAKVLCDVKPYHGNGGSIGTLGSIPNLVR